MEVNGQNFPVTSAARKGQMIPTKQKAGWTKPGWTLIKTKMVHCSCQEWNQDSSVS